VRTLWSIDLNVKKALVTYRQN